MGSPAKSQITVRSLKARGEAEPVVDAPDPSVVAAQHVPALAVGVVGDVVEQGDPRQVAVGLGGVLDTA